MSSKRSRNRRRKMRETKRRFVRFDQVMTRRCKRWLEVACVGAGWVDAWGSCGSVRRIACVDVTAHYSPARIVSAPRM